jgi:hypothetical protein
VFRLHLGSVHGLHEELDQKPNKEGSRSVAVRTKLPLRMLWQTSPVGLAYDGRKPTTKRSTHASPTLRRSRSRTRTRTRGISPAAPGGPPPAAGGTVALPAIPLVRRGHSRHIRKYVYMHATHRPALLASLNVQPSPSSPFHCGRGRAGINYNYT